MGRPDASRRAMTMGVWASAHRPRGRAMTMGVVDKRASGPGDDGLGNATRLCELMYVVRRADPPSLKATASELAVDASPGLAGR